MAASFFYLKLTELFHVGDLLLVVTCLADLMGFPGGLWAHPGFLFDLSILSGGDRELVPDGVFKFLKLVSRVFFGEYRGLKLAFT
jgi:hypothetical protein